MNANHIRSLLSKLDEASSSALSSALNLCATRTHNAVEAEHLLVRLLESPDSDVSQILRHFSVETARLSRDLNRALDALATGNSRAPVFSRRLLHVLREAWLVASVDFSAPKVRSGHLLLAMLQNDEVGVLLRQGCAEWQKLSLEALSQRLGQITAGSAEERQAQKDLKTEKPGTADNAAAVPKEDSALNKYTTDLVDRARKGGIDEVSGRDAEIRSMAAILLRRRQNNPILVGEAGVGKTAVVEGLALKIATGDVPAPLKDIALRVLDLGLLQAGAGVRGEFENRLKQVITEVKESTQPIVLFIDEAHTLIGAGGQAGQGDAANLLKPALARGELRTIAATTWSEYKQYIEDDSALARRFQVVKVAEPSLAQADLMVAGLIPSLEKHHGVRVLPEAVTAAVRLSQRYVADRQLPDKAVSVLSTACAQVELSQKATPAALDSARRRLLEIDAETRLLHREAPESHTERLGELTREKDAIASRLTLLEPRWAEEQRQVEAVRQLRAKLSELQVRRRANQSSLELAAEEKQLNAELAKLRAELRAGQAAEPLVHDSVTAQSVAEVIESWTGIPVGRMMQDEVKTLLSLGDTLRRRVVGQDDALKAISERIYTSRANLQRTDSPVGVFLLVGPSGVGKTETALAVAETLYGGERNVISINMAEYKESHSLAGLKGAPPGYVGYGKGGMLTEAIRRRPYSVVLLDEFEKAHKDVKQMFMNVFSNGILQDATGREVSFRNATLFLTSNVGARLILKACADPETRPAVDQLVKTIEGELIAAFEQELYGRLVTVPYYPLDEATLKQIVELQLQRLRQRIAESHKASLEYGDDLVNTIAASCQTTVIGARVVDQILNRTMMPGIAREILARIGAGQAVSTVRVSVDAQNSFMYQVA